MLYLNQEMSNRLLRTENKPGIDLVKGNYEGRKKIYEKESGKKNS